MENDRGHSLGRLLSRAAGGGLGGASVRPSCGAGGPGTWQVWSLREPVLMRTPGRGSSAPGPGCCGRWLRRASVPCAWRSGHTVPVCGPKPAPPGAPAASLSLESCGCPVTRSRKCLPHGDSGVPCDAPAPLPLTGWRAPRVLHFPGWVDAARSPRNTVPGFPPQGPALGGRGPRIDVPL